MNVQTGARTQLKAKLNGNWLPQLFYKSLGHINLGFAGMHLVNISRILGATQED
jgi:hypothetical protein